jgi:peptidoglycan hydrolase-like protein with peptidoglycan-binding domain
LGTNMKSLLFATILLAAPALADDRVRDVQAELKSQGFFFGNVDGKEGPETTAAIRRYQIRNGLKVTGSLDNGTLAALGIGVNPADKPADPAKEAAKPVPLTPVKPKPSEQENPPVPGETKPAAPRARDLLREDEGESRPVRPPMVPDDPNIVTPPRSLPPPVADDWTTFYHGTPYATAPREIQQGVLRKAQEQMARRRLYRGVPDGFPGPATNEAIFLYQEQERLPRTGRLDLKTLAELNLLPGRSPEAPPLKPFYNPNRRRDLSVDQRGLYRY